MPLEIAISLVVAGTAAILATPVLAKVGVKGVAQWLDASAIKDLAVIRPVWWFAAFALACLMTATLGQIPSESRFVALSGTALLGFGAAVLIQLARIDARSRLLPDQLTIALLVSGLVFHAVYFPNFLNDALIGAALGYGLLWFVAKLFLRLRGVEGMGRGDFAMAAGIGAWLGWQGLPTALLFACVFALLFAVLKNLRKSGSAALLSMELAFGPALAAGTVFAWIALG